MESHTFGFFGVRQFFIFTVSMQAYQNVCTVGEKLSVLHSVEKIVQ